MPLPRAADLVDLLRSEGSDTTTVEAKRARGGWPASVVPTLSAFSNMPGGGVVIFGVDESAQFAVSGIDDPAQLQQQLASACRNQLEPPIVFESTQEKIDGQSVVVASIPEVDASLKPVRVSASRKAYLRGYDGDYELSTLEEQAFLANRSAPSYDRSPVDEARVDDLDAELVASYLQTCRASSTALARFDDDELLFRTGVTVGDDRRPSMAGLLALGRYPQQFFPNLVIQAQVVPADVGGAGVRAIDPRRFDGPIPYMLRDGLAWLQRNSGTRVVFGQAGHGRDIPEYPTEAMRELIANALVHRDLGPHATAAAITLKRFQNRMVLSNPGGLFGITSDRLGQEGVTHARNPTLLRICQNVRFDGELRVCEALASGIPRVFSSLREAGMTPPTFWDQGLAFTVAVPNHALIDAGDLAWLSDLGTAAEGLSDTQRHALVLMRRGRTFTNRSYRENFPMDSRTARAQLLDLAGRSLVAADGERGGRQYRIAPVLPRDAVRGPRGQVEATLISGPKMVDEVAELTGLSVRQVREHLRSLRAEGRVAIVEGGRGHRITRWGATAGQLPFTATRDTPAAR